MRMSIRRLVTIIALLVAFGAAPMWAQKSVHVKGYTKKDGSVVKPHDRKAPDSSTTTSSGSSEKKAKKAKSSPAPSLPAVSRASTASGRTNRCENCDRDEHGKILRKKEAKRAFMRATGYDHGRSGYVIDHIVPLACGGPDVPSNMQWQTVGGAKAKDKIERANCR